MFDASLFDEQELMTLIKLDIDNKDLAGALTKIKTALKLEHTPTPLFAIAGKVYAQLRLFGHAETMYSRFMAEDNDHQHEKFELGMVMLEQGKTEPALAIWSEILAVEPQNPPALFYSAIAQLQQGDLAKGESMLRGLLEHIPTSNLYYERAREELRHIEESQHNQQAAGAVNH